MTSDLLRNKRLWFVTLGIVCSLLLGVAAMVRPGYADNTVCPDNWYESTDPAVLNACSYAKAIRSANEDQQAFEAAQASPYVQRIPGSSFVPELPQPENSKQIVDILLPTTNSDELQGRPGIAKNATSWWQAGSVPSAGYSTWDELWILTFPGNGAIYNGGDGATFVVNDNPTIVTFPANSDASATHTYAHTWTCPRPVSTLVVTNIVRGVSPGLGADGTNFVGLNYILYFRTKSGETGSFNMATETWTFDPPSTTP